MRKRCTDVENLNYFQNAFVKLFVSFVTKN